MNEQIKRIWQKASGRHVQGFSSRETQENFLNLFATLIVEECLNQCYNRGMNDELYIGQLKAAEYIKQHFGVEE